MTGKNYFSDNINKITKVYLRRLENEINNYFRFCDDENKENQSKVVKPYTLSGLCCYLGICREDFDILLKNIKSKRIIKNAKLRVENFIEENLLSGKISASSGVIALKYNFNWTDKVPKDKGDGETYIDFCINPEYSE